jgi:hypothetical protein
MNAELDPKIIKYNMIRDMLSKMGSIIWSVLWGVLIIGGIIGYVFSAFNTETDDKYEYKDGKAAFIEAKCFIGSIFNKDTLILSDDNIEIIKQSFFNKTKTVYPYNTLKKITFSKAFNGYKVIIECPGSFLGNDKITFYFNHKETFELLKTFINEDNKDRCVITETL